MSPRKAIKAMEYLVKTYRSAFLATFGACAVMALYGSIMISLEGYQRREDKRYVYARDIAWNAKIQQIEARVIKQDKVFEGLTGKLDEILRNQQAILKRLER